MTIILAIKSTRKNDTCDNVVFITNIEFIEKYVAFNKTNAKDTFLE